MNAPAGKIEAQSLLGALAKALAEIEGVQKNKANPGLKGARYADLSAVIDAIEPVKAYGLWYRQVPRRDPEGALIETFYIHESGDELSAGETYVPANKKDPQGFGSALTYCRRYALMTAFGLAAEDDDGHAGTQSMRNQDKRTDPAPAEARMPADAWAKLAQLIEATKSDRGAMMTHWKVPSLSDLSPSQYDEAIDMLERKLAKAAKTESNQRGGDWNRPPPNSEFTDVTDADVPF